MPETITTDVLIVGAGPAGLTAAALLARAGVAALTVTKYETAISPRAHITNQRAVEICRDLGIEDRVMARSLPYDLMGKQVFATSFAGRELSRMMSWGTGDDRVGEYRAASPCAVANLGQHLFEPILLDRARELGADIRFHHEVVAIEQDADRVTARVKPRGGAEFDVVARVRDRLRRRQDDRRKRGRLPLRGRRRASATRSPCGSRPTSRSTRSTARARCSSSATPGATTSSASGRASSRGRSGARSSCGTGSHRTSCRRSR